jgi:tRNA-specific 2-thiouridylase
MLAAAILREQGIDVTGISFTTPFFSSKAAEAASRQIGFPLLVKDITLPHMEVVRNPPSGYGANMNPCIDCHALMVLEAGRIMDREGMDFIFTGEVLGERPMSQNRRSLNRVVNLSGRKGLVLRPLSALLLDETVPEREGKVDRGRLLDIQGRSRKPQFALAEKYGIEEYPAPAGGCLLTDPSFSRRLKDLLEKDPEGETRLVEMLKRGRHFRLGPGVKVVVGRNQEENAELLELRGKEDCLLEARDVPGPVVLVTGRAGEDEIVTAARLCARYCAGRSSPEPVPVTWNCREREETLFVAPLEEESVHALRL